MDKFILANVKVPWGSLGVTLLWALFLIIIICDNRAFKVLIKKCSDQSMSTAERISSVQHFLKCHPLSLCTSNLIILMIPWLVAEKQDVMKWVKKVNGKDLPKQDAGVLLNVYFVLSESGYDNELALLKKKTNSCFAANAQFNLAKKCVLEGYKISESEISGMDDRVCKGIACYYASGDAYESGDIALGNEYGNKAIINFGSTKMRALVQERMDRYEKDN